MHNEYANFVKILEICKDFSKDLVNERGNLPRRGVVPRFSDLEVISLSLTAEYMSIDSENLSSIGLRIIMPRCLTSFPDVNTMTEGSLQENCAKRFASA